MLDPQCPSALLRLPCVLASDARATLEETGNRTNDFGDDVLIRHKRSRRDILPSSARTFVTWRAHRDVPKPDAIPDSSYAAFAVRRTSPSLDDPFSYRRLAKRVAGSS